MITLFRRFRQRLLSENKFSKYLIYAIGEIILVVIGILIALQVNNWNQNRIDSKIEKQLLSELLKNLEVNEERLKESASEEYITAQSIEYVVSTLEHKLAYNDSMDFHFGRADYASDIVLTSTAFETIKSKGFDIITSDDIRNSTIDLFDSDYGVLISQTMRLEDLYWPSSALPKFHEHFRVKTMKDRSPKAPSFGAVPVNYNALLKDTVYINMIKHRGSFRYTAAEFKQSSLSKTSLLKEKINSYLKAND
jgi:hypothetical protein